MASNGEIKIEKGVPMPTLDHGNQKYPFPQMKVGDSFFLPFSKSTKSTVRRLLTNAAISWSRRHDCKFTVRQMDGGARCWRIS